MKIKFEKSEFTDKKYTDRQVQFFIIGLPIALLMCALYALHA